MAVFENYDSNTLVSGSSDNDSIYNSGKYVTMTGGAGDDTIYNDSHYIEDGMYVTMLGGAGNDSINNAPYYANVSDVTINVGAGDDIITLGENSTKNLIKYTEGNGNDKIIGFNADSTLQIGENADGTYYSSKSGGNIIVTVGDSKITLIGAANLDTLNIQGIKKSVSNTLTLTNSSKAAVTINSAIKNVKASSRTKKIKIVGNTLDNSILGGKNSDTIYGCEWKDTLNGGNGNDKLVGGAGNDSISGVKGKDTLLGGAGNDKLLGGAGDDSISGGDNNDMLNGGAGNDKLLGGSGNDSIIGGDGNDILIGGTGNDSLWGNAGADTFIYSEDDGKDIIFGFDDKDTLTLDIDDFKASYNKKNGTITLNFDDGSITFKDFTAKTFHINNDIYKISGSKFKKQ